MAETNWRVHNHGLKERFRFILENKHYCNVNFIVGKERSVKVKASKFLLCVGSHVFHEMFVDNMVTLSIIEVPDIEPDIFEELIRYLYTDEASMKEETVVPLVHAARKYGVFGLEKLCLDFLLRECLNPSKVFSLLSKAVEIESEELIRAALKEVDECTSTAISSESFNHADENTVCKILERDSLKVREVELFEAVLRWSDFECKRRNLPLTDENKRAVLEKPLSLIRFPLMAREEFSAKVAGLNVLPPQEIIGMYRYFDGHEITLVHNSKPRSYNLLQFPISKSLVSTEIQPSEPGEIVEDTDNSITEIQGPKREKFVVKRFQKFKNKWVYLGGEYDEIGFRVDRDLKLIGVGLYSAKNPDKEYSAMVEVLERNSRKLLCEPSKVRKKRGSRDVFTVKFESPVLLEAFTEYRISVKIKGEPSLYGIDGRRKVVVDLPSGRVVTVKFFDVADGERTGVEMGQIPELYLAL